jgi:streptomycin 6-kinase
MNLASSPQHSNMSRKLARYLEAWELSDPQPLARTATSRVYTVTFGGTRVVLKLLTRVGVADERRGAAALRHFDGRGAIRLLRDDGQAHLLEYADGEDLVALVRQGEDEQATEIISEVLNRLHQGSKSPPDGLRPLRRWFRSLFRRGENDRRTGAQSIFVRAAPIAGALLDDPRQVCVLHGDIHHENIRHKTGRGWLAFDPKGLVGERTFDAANTLCNPVDMPALVEDEARLMRNAEILARALDVELSRLMAYTFAYACLSASWFLDGGDDPAHSLRVAEIVEGRVQR